MRSLRRAATKAHLDEEPECLVGNDTTIVEVEDLERRDEGRPFLHFISFQHGSVEELVRLHDILHCCELFT